MLKTLSRDFYEAITHHIIIYNLIVSSPVIYFLIIDHIVTNPSDYASLSWVFITLSFLLIITKSVGDIYEMRVETNGDAVVYKLLDMVSNTKNNKISYYQGFISDPQKKSICKHLAPRQEIKKQLGTFRKTFSSIIGLNETNVSTSVYFSCMERPFERITSESIITNAEHILSNQNSTLNYMIRNNKSIKFIPDKRIGIIQNQYAEGSRDSHYDNIGSLYCENIEISGPHQHYLNAYICVTTYGAQICDVDDIFTKNKMTEIIMPVIVEQLKIELAKIIIDEYKKCPYKSRKS